MKEEALLIASRLDTVRVLNNSKSQESVLSQAQAMIRRLVEELDKQEYRNKHEGFSTIIDKIAPQTKPTITKVDGKVVAVTMTDDEHRVHKVLWEAPKPLSDEEILEYSDVFSLDKSPLYEFTDKGLVLLIRAIEERHGIK